MKNLKIRSQKVITTNQQWPIIIIGFGIGILCFFLSYIILFSTPSAWESNKKEFEKKYNYNAVPTKFSTFNIDLLTHRLIAKDLQRGITDEATAKIARGKVNSYLEAVKSKCKFDSTDEGQVEFVQCAGKLIGQHFYYTPSIEVSNNYAINRSDCDTSTYLLMDAASQQGIDSFIVYAPFHAFFAWKDNLGQFQYWETTSSNNKGQFPDLSHNFYDKNLAHSYYTPFRGERIEDIYDTLLFYIAKIKPDLDAIYQKYPDDAFIGDWYYYVRTVEHRLTINDARILAGLLQTDLTSTNKRYALARHFLSIGEKNNALKIFKTINIKKCGNTCFRLGAELNIKRFVLFRPAFDWYSSKLQNKNSVANAGDFFLGSVMAALGAGFIFFSTVMCGINFYRRKNIN